MASPRTTNLAAVENYSPSMISHEALDGREIARVIRRSVHQVAHDRVGQEPPAQGQRGPAGRMCFRLEQA